MLSGICFLKKKTLFSSFQNHSNSQFHWAKAEILETMYLGYAHQTHYI